MSFVKPLLLAAIVILILSFNWWAPKFGLSLEMFDGDIMRQWFDGLGAWGPIAVITSMIVAILVSPIPSAPIALASGAIYGHLWGGLYVLIGAELGAIAAFCLARYLGYDFLRNWLGEEISQRLVGSQNVLMITVFASRLMPFISFDIVSYAAGLTPLSFWRFAIATLAGIIPASFLLAHFGSEMATQETSRIMVAIVILGALAAIPFIMKFIARYRQS